MGAATAQRRAAGSGGRGRQYGRLPCPRLRQDRWVRTRRAVRRAPSPSAPICPSGGPTSPASPDYAEALETLKPDAVSINTWPDTHAEYAIQAFEAGAHVFMEKPIAETVADARKVRGSGQVGEERKLVIGYILRVHPSWVKFVELAQRRSASRWSCA